MAFHQPTRQQFQRVIRVDTSDRESHAQSLAPQVQSGPDESQTWVLFSPATDAGTTTASYLSSIAESQQTPGRSRVSDLGSLNTIARSDLNSEPENSAVLSQAVVDEEEEEEDGDGELDSLDSHLPDFRTIPNIYTQQQGVLPRHDGLGSFRLGLDNSASAAELQEQLYAFERYNPRRVKRRRESLDLAQLELEDEHAQYLERNRRIEAWRLEQSHLLLDEIQKETRRRRLSSASSKAKPRGTTSEPVATSGARQSVDGEGGQDAVHATGSDWHEQDAAEKPGGLWSRITRTVIRDLMGIDDRLLSILFGEELIDGEDDLSSTPKASALPGAPAQWQGDRESYSGDSTWQLHMLEKVAQELGHFINHLSSHHPGAFSTYVRASQTPLPYAGLPVILEAAAVDADHQDQADNRPQADDSVLAMPQFKPTIAPQMTQPMDIPGAQPIELVTETLQPAAGAQDGIGNMTPTRAASHANAGPLFTQQEWEQDLDIKLVFRYLRSRFTGSRASPTSFTSGTSHLATSSTQDAAAKAARIRQHHPLVSHAHHHGHGLAHAHQRERRSFKATTPSSPVAVALHRHSSGSCASQSTRRSTRRGSVSSRHSSRHYWDIGGSNTGSIIASAGPMGSWGEV